MSTRDLRKLAVWQKSHVLTLEIAMGSASELEYQLMLSRNLDSNWKQAAWK